VILNQWVRDKQSEETLWKAELEQIDIAETADPAAGALEGFQISGMDLKAGIERYEGETVYLQILRSYTLHTPEQLLTLRALSPETLPDYAVTVHGLKGASYGICAGEIGRQAEALEYAAKAGDYVHVKSGNMEFIAQVEAVLVKIGELLREVEENGPEKQKAPSPQAALLEKLLDACKRFKPAVMEEVLSEIEGYEYETGGELVPWLREQLDNLEYEAIRERLEGTVVPL
jgi:hypothetical protein